MKLSRSISLAIVGFWAALPLESVAQDAPELTFNVGAASDYVFRGVSLSDEKPEVFGGATLSFKSTYAGVWVSNADFSAFGDDSTDAEFDLLAGWKPTLGAVALDLGVVYYGYVDQPGGGFPAQDYWEGYATASLPLGPATLGASYYYSPRSGGGAGKTSYVEANAAYGRGEWSVSGAVGRQWVKVGVDYTTWNLGVGYAITPHIGVDLRYWDTNAKTPELDDDDARFVASIKATF